MGERLVLTLLALCSAAAAQQGTFLYEVHFSSWFGDRIRQFDIRSINQVSDVLECAALGAKYLASDQLLVFIGGEPQCLIASKSMDLCRRLPLRPDQSPCCIRVFARSLDNCWTSIQRRVDNSTDFYRNWTEYAAGFGQGPHGNYWIGLQALHSLTWPNSTSLHIRMKPWNNTEYWADYTSFSVASEADKFRLSISGFRAGQGNLGDAMAYHNGMNFTTMDSDNDAYPEANCAWYRMGGWWYNLCFKSNPNGLYYSLPSALNIGWYSNGVHWSFPFGIYYSLKEFEMLIP